MRPAGPSNADDLRQPVRARSRGRQDDHDQRRRFEAAGHPAMGLPGGDPVERGVGVPVAPTAGSVGSPGATQPLQLLCQPFVNSCAGQPAGTLCNAGGGARDECCARRSYPRRFAS